MDQKAPISIGLGYSYPELISDLLTTGMADLLFEVAHTTLRTALNMGRNVLLLGLDPWQ